MDRRIREVLACLLTFGRAFSVGKLGHQSKIPGNLQGWIDQFFEEAGLISSGTIVFDGWFSSYVIVPLSAQALAKFFGAIENLWG
jgi:hypothetical protein